ncbi:hypothetical protein GCM10009785_16940 [Brooklawnia cerclae]|uniref:ABC-type Fe3+ transport system substrate-binding protein n=1 Tax=Brooklawnia cerclae TaxID=349934 RepID=A0ABX0SID8_9ACTN|nr:ABC transporter substrate-binding protein [Brooklawnia cerclae]NIH57736.1 ABC-type Fe3+ transport system substrate-binding protein [Brooklawnia cerclae]
MVQTIGIESLLSQHAPSRHLDFKVEVPCPVKNRFQAAYEAFLRKQYETTGRRFYSFVPSMCGEHADVPGTLRDIAAVTSADDLPEVAIDSASGAFTCPAVVDRFVRTGAFQRIHDLSGVPFLNGAEFTDPYGAYNVIAVNPEVLLVDRKALGDRPVPRSIEDLLDPIYTDSICIADSHRAIGTRFLTYIYLTYGEEGLDAIDRTIGTALNGPTVARTAGHTSPAPAAIYMAPWVFAQGAVKPGRLEIVWPSEGALCNPTLLMVRADLSPENQALVDFALSPELGEVFATSNLPSTVPGAPNVLPRGARVQWPGWGHLLDGDQASLDATLMARFGKYHRSNSC